MALRPFVLGTFIGIVPASLMYFTVPAYHNYIQWQFQHPAILVPAALIGLAIGYFAD